MDGSRDARWRVWDLVGYLFGERARPPVRSPSPELLRELTRLHRLDVALAEPRLTAVSPAAHVDPETWHAWESARAAALARTLWRGQPLRRTLALLAPMPVIVLKGAAFAELLYPSPAARSLGDVDVLVRSSDMPEALVRLEGHGFVRHNLGDPSTDAPDSPERQLGSPDLELDLHQAFTQPARLSIDYGAVFARSLDWSSLAPNARLLSPEDAVVYQAIHAGCGELSVATAPAFGLFDLRLMFAERAAFWGAAGGPPLDFAAAVHRAAEWGAERMLYAVLTAAARLFPSLAQAAAAAARPLPARLCRRLDRAVVERAIPPGVVPPVRAEVYLRKALLLRPAARLRLLAHRLPRVAVRRARR